MKFLKVFCLFIVILGCDYKENVLVPDIKGVLLSKKDFDLRSESKNRITVINVWSIYCKPCILEMPTLHNIYNRYLKNDKILFITIALNSKREIESFVNHAKSDTIYSGAFKRAKINHYTLPTLIGLDSSHTISYLGNDYFVKQIQTKKSKDILSKLGVFALPTTLIYDTNGKQVINQIGFDASNSNDCIEKNFIVQKIDSLLTRNLYN